MTNTSSAVLDGRYALGDPLGRGGACDVFIARDRRLQRNVAVKLLRGEGIGDAHRMATEVQLLASFNHPGLVQVYDAGEVHGQPYVVLELVEGDTLADRLREGSVSPPAAASLGVAIADALASVHDRGVVHRDITPANVLCGVDGRVRVADFGIARLVDSARHTTASVALGTPAYMAPEQVRGVAATPTADVYALGLVLLECLTGRRAFDGTGTEVALARLVRSPDTTTDVPDAWRPLLAAMTALDPMDRPSAADVRDRLERLLTASEESTAAVPVAVVTDEPDDADPFAATASLPVAEPVATGAETAVLPLSATPREGGRRRSVLAAIAVVVALAIGAGLAQAASDGGELVPPATTTSTQTPTSTPTTDAVVQVSATTTPPPKATPPAAPKPKGKGKAHPHPG